MTITGSDTFSGSIANGESETLSLYSETAERLHVLIDDGTTGSPPAEYDLTHRAQPSGGEISRFQFYQDETGRTARSYRFESVGLRTEIEIENVSGGSAEYEIAVIAHE